MMPISADDVAASTKDGNWPQVRGVEDEREAWCSFTSYLDETYDDDSLGKVDAESTIPYDRPYNRLMIEIYRYVISRHTFGCKRSRFQMLINGFAKQLYPYKKIGVKTNIFLVVLLFLGGSVSGLLNKKVRSQMAGQMLYAFRHNIEADLLVGFIYQSGGKIAICRKVKDNSHRESWFSS